MTIGRALLVIIASLSALTCHDNGVDGGGGGYSPSLRGTVTGALGNPISGVGIHYIFSLDPTTQLAPLTKPLPTTVIHFDLQADAAVTLRILRYGTRELLGTLIDHEQMAAGIHEVDFDASSYTTGLYIFQLLIEGLPPQEHLMALLKLDVRELEASTPLTTTDYRGRFSLPVTVFGIGVRFAITIDNPTPIGYVVVSDSINLVLTKPGYESLVVPMTVDTTRNRSMEFRMTPVEPGCDSSTGLIGTQPFQSRALARGQRCAQR